MTSQKTLRKTLLAGVAGAALLLTGCSGFLTSDTTDNLETAAPEVKEKIDTVITQALEGSKSTQAIVGVWLPDGTSYVRGYGDGVDMHTFVRAGQQTAPAACALLMELANEKLLEFDEIIAEKFPRHDHILGNTTYRQLCDGSSGYADYKNNLLWHEVVTPARLWHENELISESLAHSPLPHMGLNYYLSDTDTVIAAKVARLLTSEGNAELYQNRLFEPKGLKNTYYPAPKDNSLPENTLTPISLPGMPGEPSCDVEPAKIAEVSPSFLAGAGATITTAADLHSFYSALFAGKFGGEKIFTELNKPNSLVNPERDADSNPTNKPEPVAEGKIPHSEIVLGAEKIGPLYGRSSWLPGTVGATYHDPESKFTVVIQLNNSSVRESFAKNAALLLAAQLSDAGVKVPWSVEAAQERFNEGAICQPAAE